MSSQHFQVGLLLALLLPAAHAAPGEDAQADNEAVTTDSLRGRVVFLSDALERLHGVKSVAAARENTLVLETPGGKLYPLVEDKRGHAFRLDERLMGQPMELLVRRRADVPAIQVIRVYAIDNGERFQVDYWCDVCAIEIYELKPCDCCQGPIRLRKRKLDKDGQPLPEEGPPPAD